MVFDQNAIIVVNVALRVPQQISWQLVRDHFQRPGASGDVSILARAGCGKSGLTAISQRAATPDE
ncbi:hypothetical protein [Afifella pfennigii]|uniref:hypothetical protein n=1 Tax=Afifella pfennigii TaxID=209897 RepID=UPI0012EB2233|nr:hypothetical protein [Afifella pfennigii]